MCVYVMISPCVGRQLLAMFLKSYYEYHIHIWENIWNITKSRVRSKGVYMGGIYFIRASQTNSLPCEIIFKIFTLITRDKIVNHGL